MKQRGLKIQSERGGWIRTTLAPINDRAGSAFGVKELAMLLAIIALVVVVARVCLAH